MKKQFFILVFVAIAAISAQGQSRGVRIGYIDMEYILQNVPDYAEAKNQLELKAQKWKQELEVKKNEITKLKESLKTEKVLLTKELIEEREEAITFLENELSDYQQKRFGPNGDFIVQKEMLVKPIQDQIFNAVQDIAEKRKYDFIFDKTSDLTMLFAAKRFDVSDLVVRAISRTNKAEQRTKKQIKADEAKEYKEEVEDANPILAERRKDQEARKEALEKKNEDRKVATAEAKKVADEKRQAILDERSARKAGTVVAKKEANTTTESKTGDPENAEPTPAEVQAAIRNEQRKAATEARAKDFEIRKKEIEDRKAKVLADREAAKKAKEELKNNKPK